MARAKKSIKKVKTKQKVAGNMQEKPPVLNKLRSENEQERIVACKILSQLIREDSNLNSLLEFGLLELVMECVKKRCFQEVLDLVAIIIQIGQVEVTPEYLNYFLELSKAFSLQFLEHSKNESLSKCVNSHGEDEITTKDIEKKLVTLLEIISGLVCSSNVLKVPQDLLLTFESLFCYEPLQDSILLLFDSSEHFVPSPAFVESIASSLSLESSSGLSRSAMKCSVLFNACHEKSHKRVLYPVITSALHQLLTLKSNMFSHYSEILQSTGSRIDLMTADLLKKGNAEAKKHGKDLFQLDNEDTKAINLLSVEIESIVNGVELLADMFCMDDIDDWEDTECLYSADICMKESSADKELIMIVKNCISESQIFPKLAELSLELIPQITSHTGQSVIHLLYRFKARIYSAISNILLNRLINISTTEISLLWNGCFEFITGLNMVSQDEDEVVLIDHILTTLLTLSSLKPNTADQFHVNFLTSIPTPKTIRALTNIADMSNTMVILFI